MFIVSAAFTPFPFTHEPELNQKSTALNLKALCRLPQIVRRIARIDPEGRPYIRMTEILGDLLHRHAILGHDTRSGMPQLMGRALQPRPPCRTGDPLLDALDGVPCPLNDMLGGAGF